MNFSKSWLLVISLLVIALSSSSVYAEDELSDLDKALFDAAAEEDTGAAAAALKQGANINVLSPRGRQTPLMQSVLHGRTKMVEFFLENGADVNIGERDGYTPMHVRTKSHSKKYNAFYVLTFFLF
jgi:hypothetical protein